MSIFPVKLSEWFPKPKGPKKRPGYKDDLFNHEVCVDLVKTSVCLACGKKPKWEEAIGHHSVPWGHGDIWCNEECSK